MKIIIIIIIEREENHFNDDYLIPRHASTNLTNSNCAFNPNYLVPNSNNVNTNNPVYGKLNKIINKNLFYVDKFLQCDTTTPNIDFKTGKFYGTICNFRRLKRWSTLTSVTSIIFGKYIKSLKSIKNFSMTNGKNKKKNNKFLITNYLSNSEI